MTMPKTVAFQGEPGANSHLAIREVYPGAEAVPCATFEDAFAAITSGEADLGMIPIENSVAGRVADIHHLMPDSGLHIVAEHFMPVRHQLLAPKGASLEGIKTVESHVHALGQCRRIIRKLGIRPIVSGDTAGAARLVAERGDTSCAASRVAMAARDGSPASATSRAEPAVSAATIGRTLSCRIVLRHWPSACTWLSTVLISASLAPGTAIN